MKPDKLLLITETLPEQRILEAIFADLIKEERLVVRSYSLSSAAISVAVSSLLADPDRPIALILNSETDDPIAIGELRGTVERILGRIAVRGWHLALAVPRVYAWANAYPRIAEAVEAEKGTGHSEREQADRIGAIVLAQPFNVKALRKANAEFRGLDEYISRTVGKSSASRRRAHPRTAR